MKVTYGGTRKITVSQFQYEPVQVEATLIIEEEVEGLENLQDFKDKVNTELEKELLLQIQNTLEIQKEIKSSFVRKPTKVYRGE